jgi:large exoprotein involved in heme utilization and adhesion
MLDRSLPASLPLALFLAGLMGLLSGCAAPFADLQGARLAGRGNLEVTGSFSTVHYSANSQSDEVQREYTVQLAAGTGDHTDWRFRYTRVGPPGGSGGGGINVFGAGPKFANASQRFAVALPVGFAVGQDISVGDTFQFHPTMFFTFPSGRTFEVNLSGKALVPLSGGSTGFAANLGFGLSSDLDRWALRPEIGVLTYPAGEGYFPQFSVGFSYNLGR